MNVFFYQTAIGKIGIADDGEKITRIFISKDDIDKNDSFYQSELNKKAFAQINEFIEGKRKSFDFAIHIEGTPFQKKVWEALMRIPYGQTKSYKQISEMVNEPKKYRAVGGACNKNPLLLAVPCHRVIGSSGSLIGFAAGLDVKKQLLATEKKCNG